MLRFCVDFVFLLLFLCRVGCLEEEKLVIETIVEDDSTPSPVIPVVGEQPEAQRIAALAAVVESKIQAIFASNLNVWSEVKGFTHPHSVQKMDLFCCFHFPFCFMERERKKKCWRYARRISLCGWR